MKSQIQMYKNLLYAIIIILLTVLTYTASVVQHNVEGYFGFSSLRVTINQLSFYLFAFLASCRLFYVEKGKPYRFVYLVPVTALGYNLLVNLFDARQTYFNEFTPRFGLTILVSLFVVFYYFNKRSK